MEHRGLSARYGSAGGRSSAQEGVAGNGPLDVLPPCQTIGCDLQRFFRHILQALGLMPAPTSTSTDTTVHRVTMTSDGGPAPMLAPPTDTAAAAVTSAAALQLDPTTGLLIDAAGNYYDPSTLQPVDPSSYSSAAPTDDGGGTLPSDGSGDGSGVPASYDGSTSDGGAASNGAPASFSPAPAFGPPTTPAAAVAAASPTPAPSPTSTGLPPGAMPLQPATPAGAVAAASPTPAPAPGLHLQPIKIAPSPVKLAPTPAKPAPQPLHLAPLKLTHAPTPVVHTAPPLHLALGAPRTPALDALARDAVFSALTGGR